MAKGGRQPGAGRPKGSTNKIRFADYVSEKDRATFVEFMLSTYMADMRVATWIGDQLFGKAPQAITGPEGGPVEITLVKYADHPTPPLRT
jgi:hypothetical protein